MSAFTTLPDHRLLAELHELVRNERTLEAQLLSHLGEVDKRRLYLREACSSMFSYCVDVLHFSEASAFKRIAAARAAREFPELLAAVDRGELHVTAVRLLAPHLNSANADQLIALAKHRTAEQIKRQLADLHPKPDVTTSVRRVAPTSPATNTTSAPPIELPAVNGRSSDGMKPEMLVTGPIAPRPVVQSRPSTAEPLGGDRYSIRFSAGSETHAQLRELQALLRHKFPSGDLGAILGHAIALLHKQIRKQKFADCEKPRRPAVRDAVSSSERESRAIGRKIPASIRRAVAKRDEERCSYATRSGLRCNATGFLEFHHVIPWARVQSHEIDNITLRCRAHNQYAADRDFGLQHMAQFKTPDTANPALSLPVCRREQGVTGQLDLSPVKSPGS